MYKVETMNDGTATKGKFFGEIEVRNELKLVQISLLVRLRGRWQRSREDSGKRDESQAGCLCNTVNVSYSTKRKEECQGGMNDRARPYVFQTATRTAEGIHLLINTNLWQNPRSLVTKPIKCT